MRHHWGLGIGHFHAHSQPKPDIANSASVAVETNDDLVDPEDTMEPEQTQLRDSGLLDSVEELYADDDELVAEYSVEDRESGDLQDFVFTGNHSDHDEELDYEAEVETDQDEDEGD